MKKIMYQNLDGEITIITPCIKHLSFETVGAKGTPKGLPFWIIDESELPTGRTNRDAWELDGSQGDPDGYGE